MQVHPTTKPVDRRQPILNIHRIHDGWLSLKKFSAPVKYLLLVLLPLGFCSCYYDHAEDIYPVGNCSPASVSYAANITEILNRNSCVSCHNASLASGAVRLDNYTGVTTVAANGRLWGSINHSPGFVSMPQGLGKISQCDLNKIKIWIDAGQPQ